MQQLVIEYNLAEGRPGYRWQPPVDGFSEETLKAIWRQAMPRGQGWSDARFEGAQALKTFRLADGRAVISRVAVTDQVDEGGRRGIRRAQIDVLGMEAYAAYLRERLDGYAVAIRQVAGAKLSVGRWARILERAVPRLGDRDQIVLTHPYRSAEQWQVIEFMIVYLATRWSIRAMRGWPPLVPFTTLALDTTEEAPIVAIPAQKAAHIKARKVIQIP